MQLFSMHEWHWQGPDNAYLSCSLLQDWDHGFFTHRVWPNLPETILSVLQPEAHSETQVYRLKQVHGNRVLDASALQPLTQPLTAAEQAAGSDNSPDAASDSQPHLLPEADGLFSTVPNQAVWVCTADCTPVLIGDVATGQVAAIHAGWRGTAMQIVPQAIARLQSQGSRIPDLRVAMGPAIAGEVYQVSTTVAAQVGATILTGLTGPTELAGQTNLLEQANGEAEFGTAAAEKLCAQLQQLPNSPVLTDSQPGRARLDVRQVNALQLAQLGFKPDQIAIAPYCTYQTPKLFFSYRRERQKKVQWSGIVSRALSKRSAY